MGMAIMGTGYGEGKDRAVEAANRAIASPLIEEAQVEGARGVIINITGGSDLSMLEVSQATTIIHEAGARGRQHHLWRGGRYGHGREGQDHGYRHGLRGPRGAQSRCAGVGYPDRPAALRQSATGGERRADGGGGGRRRRYSDVPANHD